MQSKNFISRTLTYFQDARHFQIAYLSSFLLLGILFLGWQQHLAQYILVISTSLFTQALGAKFIAKQNISLKSAFITSLGLCLLLHTNHYYTAIIAAFVAIAGKFLIRYKGKHIFNPVNFGIVIMLIFSNNAWISPGQWGNHLIVLFAVGILGFLVLKKVNRLDASMTFILVFCGLNFIRSVVYLGWTPDVFYHQISSGTLVLFTFFMITDPMTTPNHRKARIIWVSLIAIVAFIVSNYVYIFAAPIWVLFFASPLTPVFDKIFTAQKFEWNQSKSILNFK